ncbi:MAG: hypothetical protein HMLKMBBP_01376 [Planctomycetes bacterium]|nr:hypothetical protein [Planctomycetota bacterium]
MPARSRKLKVRDLLLVGVAPRVMALRRDDGSLVWERKLKTMSTVVSVLQDGELAYAGTAGEVWCLDALSGDVIWHNKLVGYGTGYVTMAGADTAASAAAAATAQAAAAAAAANTSAITT